MPYWLRDGVSAARLFWRAEDCRPGAGMKPDADAQMLRKQGQTLTRKTLDDRARENCAAGLDIRGTNLVEQCRAHGRPFRSPQQLPKLRVRENGAGAHGQPLGSHQRTGAVAWLCGKQSRKAT